MTTLLSGGCHCGRLRYQTDGPVRDQTNCHCSICRRTTGAPFVTWFTVDRAAFRLLQGEPARYPSSARATRSFCRECGTQISFEHAARAHELDITVASLDQPNAVAPRDHTYVDSKLGWVQPGDGLPQFPQARA